MSSPEQVRRRLEMPLLMVGGMIGAGLFAGVTLIVLPASLLGAGDYHLQGRPVTASEFWSSGAAPMLGVVAAWLGAVAVGFRQEKLWARPLAASYWFLMAAAVPFVEVQGAALEGVLSSCGFGLFALWYFYRKSSVRAYYAAIKGEQPAP